MMIIVNAKVIFPGEIREGLAVVCQDGIITDILPVRELGENVVTYDAGGLYLSPGFVDIHVHGGGGFGFMDGTPESIEASWEGNITEITAIITNMEETLFNKIAQAEHDYWELDSKVSKINGLGSNE